jgi:hypothetical protein
MLVDGPAPLPPPGLPEDRLLTIATVADDFDGVYFSIQAIRFYHPEIVAEVQFLVLDPRPDAPSGEALRALGGWIPGYTYWPFSRDVELDLRDLPFRHGGSEFVLVMEPHVLFLPGSLQALIRYLADRRSERELLQGPLVSADLQLLATHREPGWHAGRWGRASIDGRVERAEPFEIDMQDLGVFVCRRDSWPGINPRLTGAAGLEGYLHEKFRRAGGSIRCLPFLRWQRQDVAPPTNDRLAISLRDHLVMHQELGFGLQPLREHFVSLLGEDKVATLLDERDNPFAFLDAIYCVSSQVDSQGWWRAHEWFCELGIERRVRRVPSIATPTDPRIGRTLARRAVIEEARWQGLDSVLVLDAQRVFAASSLDELRAARGPSRDPARGALWWEADGTSHSLDAAGPVGAVDWTLLLLEAPAFALESSRFDDFLEEVPATPSGVAQWLRRPSPRRSSAGAGDCGTGLPRQLDRRTA